MKVAEATLDRLIVPRPEPTPEHPQHLCRAKGFDYPETDRAALARGYTLHTARKRKRGQSPAQATQHRTGTHRHPPRRWVVERTQSWHNRFRKLRIRYEKKPEHYRALVQFACALIVYRLRLLLG